MVDTPMPDQLAAAAHRLLDEQGPSSLSVRKLAAFADVAPMTIYNHFGAKDAMIDRIVRDGFAELRARLLASSHRRGSIERLRDGAHAYRRLARERPHLYAVMFEHAIAGYVPTAGCMATAGSSFDAVVVDVRAAQAKGVVVKGDPVEIAERIWATLHGLVTLELHGYGFVTDRDVHFAATVDTILRGLRPARRAAVTRR